MKVIIAMSGGVDSSVAAYLLKEQGHEVIGLSFELWDKRDLAESNVCCSIETINLARAVSESLGIEHHTVDVRDSFYHNVIEDFCESYIKGITPNPCILCNKYIKFDFMMQKAKELGADLISTLYVMKQEELARTVFPLGEMNKEETRRIAKDIGLATATRAESQEICFVGNDKYPDFIKSFSPDALTPGPVVDMSGRVIGEHKGIAFYTIGQRKGLGISSPEPHYVADIKVESNTVVAGKREDALKKTITIKDINWVSWEGLSGPVRAGVKIRSTTREKPATLYYEDNETVIAEFDEPEWAPASGQSAVFYDDDMVIGGGIIK
jgi:tRNA-specific 2-thiouridylase